MPTSVRLGWIIVLLPLACGVMNGTGESQDDGIPIEVVRAAHSSVPPPCTHRLCLS